MVRVVAVDEHGGHHEGGGREQRRRDQGIPVSGGQGGGKRAVVDGRHARRHGGQDGDSETGADLAGGVQQPADESLLGIADPCAAGHGRGERRAAVAEPDREQRRGDQQVFALRADS